MNRDHHKHGVLTTRAYCRLFLFFLILYFIYVVCISCFILLFIIGGLHKNKFSSYATTPSILSNSTLCVGPFSATPLLFWTSGPVRGESPDYWDSAELIRAPIPRNGSGKTNQPTNQPTSCENGIIVCATVCNRSNQDCTWLYKLLTFQVLSTSNAPNFVSIPSDFLLFVYLDFLKNTAHSMLIFCCCLFFKVRVTFPLGSGWIISILFILDMIENYFHRSLWYCSKSFEDFAKRLISFRSKAQLIQIVAAVYFSWRRVNFFHVNVVDAL